MDLILHDHEFSQFQKMIYDMAGIHMTEAKKPLVRGRLVKRVQHYALAGFGDYLRLLKTPGYAHELQTAVDLLTTNETYFFREPKHFDFLCQRILPQWSGGGLRRVWSAASSSGEEAYTLAMLLANQVRHDWQIIGTDICTRVLDKARRAHYPIDRAANIPEQYLKAWCLKGVGSQEGTFLISKSLREKVSFVHANLQADLTELGSFDLILLRNVLIYFDQKTKQQVVARLLRQLKPGGYFMVGHSESLNGVSEAMRVITPSVYQKP